MVQIASGAYSGDKAGVRVPLWDDPTIWTVNFLGKVTTQPQIVHWYQNWHDAKKDWNQGRIDTLTARGELPLLSWAPRNSTLSNTDPTYNHAAILAGTHDAYINDWATKAAAYGRPMIFRPMWEMNSTVFSWGVGVQGQTGTTYIDAFRYLVDKFRAAGATNVKWMFCPLAAGSFPVTSMYPGDTYVDYVGLDGYNGMGTDTWTTPAQIFDAAYTSLTGTTAPSKPLAIAEVGSMETFGDKAAWITDLFAKVQTNWPKTRIITWFDLDNSALGERDWRVNTSQAALDAYNGAIDNPENMGSVETYVQYITKAETQNASATSVSVNMPTGLLNNDVLIMSVAVGASADVTVPSDWTGFGDQTDLMDPVTPTGNMRLKLYWKRTTGTEGAPTVTAAAARPWEISVTVWRGCITTDSPIGAIAMAGANAPIAAGTPLNLPTLTTSGPNRRIVGNIYIRDLTNAALANLTWSNEFNEESELQATAAATNSRTNGLADSFSAAQGQVTPSVTPTNSQQRYVAATFGLIPQPYTTPVVTRTDILKPTSTDLVSGLTPTDSASATAILDEGTAAVGTDFLTGTDPSNVTTTNGPEYVDASASATGLTATTWTNPANMIDTSETTVATFALGANSTDYGTFFSWNAADWSDIPSNATITAISVTARMRAQTASRLTAWLQLGTANGSLIGTEQTVNAGAALPITLADYTIASWGAVPTRAQLISGTFGVRLRMRRSNAVTAELASIKATVTYTTPGTTNPIEVRVNMANPVDPIAKNSNVNGEMRLQVRKKGNGADPPVTVELRESDVLLATLASATTISSTTSQIVAADFNHNLITNPDNVQFWITSPGVVGSMVEVGAVDWYAEVIPPVYTLDWNDNTEIDLAGYNIYRTTTSGSGYTKINTSLVTTSTYVDTTGTTGQTYYYVVRAVDLAGNESGNSTEATATTGPVTKSGAVSIAAAATVTPVGVTRKTGAASILGAASVAVAGIVRKTGAASISGAATITVGSVVRKSGAVPVAGAATITVGSVVHKPGAASILGAGSVTVNGLTHKPGAASISGLATVTAAGQVGTGVTVVQGAVGITSAASVAVEGVTHKVGASTISGVASVAVGSVVVKASAAPISGTATISVGSVVHKSSTVPIAATSSVAVTGLTHETGAASILAAATLTATGQLGTGVGTVQGAVAISSVASVSATGLTHKAEAVSIAGVASVAVGSVLRKVSTASISGTATISVGGVVLDSSAVSIAGISSVTVTALTHKSGTASISSGASLSVGSSARIQGQVSISGQGTLFTEGVTSRQGSVAAQGLADVLVTPRVVHLASTSINAAGSLSVASVTSMRGVASIAALAQLVGAPIYVRRGSVSITGVSTLNAGGGGSKQGSVSIDAAAATLAITASVYHQGRAPPISIASVVGFSGVVSDIQDAVESTTDTHYLAAV